MRLNQWMLAVAVGLAMLSGCENDQTMHKPVDGVERRQMNAWTLHAFNDRQIAQGIISQGTLYPHHFEAGSAELNELGERDLSVLAGHLQKNPGPLNVRRGGAEDALYDARLASVRAQLEQRGVAIDTIELADHAQGGEGLVSERTLVIMGAETDRPSYPPSIETMYEGGGEIGQE